MPGVSSVITGLGLISPLGLSPWSTFRALLQGRTVSDRVKPSETERSVMSLVIAAGGIPDARMVADDPSIGLAVRAARQAIESAGLAPAQVRAMPLILASSKGAICATVAGQNRAQASAESAHGFLLRRVGEQLGITQRSALVAACASGIVALDSARRTIARAQADRVLVIAVEASLIPMLVHSYRRLGVLPPLTRNEYHGRPLDRQRCGFTLNEIAAAVVLQAHPCNKDEASASSTQGAIKLLHTRVLCEAYHIVRSPPDGAALRELAHGAARFGPIDLVHPHATGTIEHDELELRALARGMQGTKNAGRQPPVYAVKGAIGHGLGASGLVSLVIAALIGRTGRLPPMPWITDPIPSTFRIEPGGLTGDWKTHAIFSAGFGGHVATAVIRC